MNIPDFLMINVFWFGLGSLVHDWCFGDLFDNSSWRKSVISIVFGGPIFLMYFLIRYIIIALNDFRNK